MKAVLVSFFLVFSVQAFAITPNEILSQEPIANSNQNDQIDGLFGFDFLADSQYQIGAEWGKKVVDEDDLNSDSNFARMAFATAKVRSGGTGFFLGKFNGRYLIATNHHVCPAQWECSAKGAVYFPLLDVRATMVEFYGSWPEIDLSLFSIKLTDDDAQKLMPVASPFAFNHEITHGELLVTMGFGVADNPERDLVANRDSDCRVYSANGEYRLMADPDDLNPGPYKAWSFANGCDVSHGDSGSAMMDRVTGEVVGIIWTGRIPKDKKVQNADFMDGIFAHPNEDVWKQLSYSVPAVKMKVFLSNLVAGHNLAPEYEKTIVEVLNSGN